MSPREAAIAAADRWLLRERHTAIERARRPMNDDRDPADLERSYLGEVEEIQAQHRDLLARIDIEYPKETADGQH